MTATPAIPATMPVPRANHSPHTLFTDPTTTMKANSAQQQPTRRTLNSQLVRMAPRTPGRGVAHAEAERRSTVSQTAVFERDG